MDLSWLGAGPSLGAQRPRSVASGLSASGPAALSLSRHSTAAYASADAGAAGEDLRVSEGLRRSVEKRRAMSVDRVKSAAETSKLRSGPGRAIASWPKASTAEGHAAGRNGDGRANNSSSAAEEIVSLSRHLHGTEDRRSTSAADRRLEVRTKALSLPCVSTVFLSKTVPLHALRHVRRRRSGRKHGTAGMCLQALPTAGRSRRPRYVVQDCNSGPLPLRMSSKSFPVCVLDHEGVLAAARQRPSPARPLADGYRQRERRAAAARGAEDAGRLGACNPTAATAGGAVAEGLA
eukprot:SAG22_NODE_1052_length_5802_cov_1.994564_3_plen_292_part_00